MLLAFFLRLVSRPLDRLEPLYLRWTQLPKTFVALSSALDLTRSKSDSSSITLSFASNF